MEGYSQILDTHGRIKKAAKLKNTSGKTYETLQDIDFSKVDISNQAFSQVAERNGQTNEPTTFILRVPDIAIKAGETTITSVSVGDYVKFRKITLADDDVLEVVQITDSEGNQWYEVDYLSQDTIFDTVTNSGQDSDLVPYVLKLRSVPYRFITEYNFSTGKTSIIFGSGDAQSFDGELIPDLGDLSLPAFGKDTFTDFTLDPQNFLKTRTLGLSPVNTNLIIKYRVGGGFDTNAGTGEINTVVEKVFDVSDSLLSQATIRDVGNSFSVFNTSPIKGGNDQLDPEELKQIIPSQFAAQSRVVTTPDFIVRSLSLPAKYGSIFRANATPNSLNRNSVELIVLSRDSNGYITTASPQLKENLKTYLSRFRMLTDSIEILDGQVINVGLSFGILTNPDFNKLEILSNCIDSLKEHFLTENQQLNQPINMSDLYVLLKAVPGVVSVINLDIRNIVGNFQGRQYSNTNYNIKDNSKNGILYSKENSIFEIKFPDIDISGVAK